MEQGKRKEFKDALRERIMRAAALERRKETIGSIPMRSLDPLIDLATDAAVSVFTPEPGEEARSNEEVVELIAAGNRMATKLAQMVRGKRTGHSSAQKAEYTEVRRLVRQWDSLIGEGEDDEDDEPRPMPLVAHPQLRVKDWEQIWSVMSGGAIKDYDGFTDVGVEQTMTVEEFMERLIKCTLKLGTYRGFR